MLTTQPFVRVFAIDFSKAFDTVRHAALMEKMARIAIPYAVYNWINDFFRGHSHCTKYDGITSELADIVASRSGFIRHHCIGPSANAYRKRAGKVC